MGIAPNGTGGHFLHGLLGWCPKGLSLCAQEVEQRTPQPPVHPCPAWADRDVHQDSFALSAVTGRLPAGYRQPGCDFIHCCVSQCQSAVFHIIPAPQLQLGEESSACSTGWGYCNLLILLAVCLLLPQRSLSPQMLSMLECGFVFWFVFCDHSI